MYYDHTYQRGDRLPLSWLEPPDRPPLPSEIRWRLRPPFDAYEIDCWKRLFRRAYTDGRGHERGARQVLLQRKNGSVGFLLHKAGRRYWMPARALRRHVVKV